MFGTNSPSVFVALVLFVAKALPRAGPLSSRRQFNSLSESGKSIGWWLDTNRRSAAARLWISTSSWWAPGSPACTCCIACAAWGSRRRCFESADDVGRHLVLEPLPRRALRHREHRLLVQLRPRAGSRVAVVGALRHAAGDPALPRVTSPTSTTCGATSASRPGSSRPPGTTTPRAGGSAPTAATSIALPLLRDGDGLPVAAQDAGHRGRRALPGRRRTTPAGGRTTASTSPASASPSSAPGSSGVQSIPIIAQQAAELTVFQRTPNFSRPAKNGPVPPRRRRRSTPTRPRTARRRGWSRAGVPLELPHGARAPGAPRRSGWRSTRRRTQSGDLLALGRPSPTSASTPRPTRPLCEFLRGKIRSIVRDPETAEALCPKDHFYGTKRPCLDTNYYETFNLPHVRLVDLRKDPIRDDHRDGHRHRVDASFEFDAIVFATGFDAMTGAIVAVDITRARRPVARGQVGRRSADLPRPDDGGFPNFFTDHRPGQPVGAVEHGGVDRAARRVGGRLPRPHARRSSSTSIEPTPLAEAGWVQHVNDCGDITLFPRANSWYMGANVPGQAARVPALRRRRRPLPQGLRRGGQPRLPRLRLRRAGRRALPRRRRPPAAARRRDPARRWSPSSGCRRSRRCRSRTRARLLASRMAAERPPGPEVGEIVDGELPGAAGPLAYRLYRPATPGPASDRRLLPRRRLGARQRRLRRSASAATSACAPTPSSSRSTTATRRRRASPRPSTTGSPPCAGSRRTPPSSGGIAGPAGGVRLERRRQHRRRRLPAGARCRRPARSPARCW